MNEATAKRWISDLPLSKDEKLEALSYIVDKSDSEIKSYLFQLRQKSGGKKKTATFAVK